MAESEVRVTQCGRTVLVVLVVAVATAPALPARSQETAPAPEAAAQAEAAPEPGSPGQDALIEETAAVGAGEDALPACAQATGYKACVAACRETFPKKPKVETRQQELAREKLAVHGWWALGTGAALVVAGAVTGGVALHLDAELSDECPGGSCPPSAWSDLDTRDDLALSSTVLLGAGVAASAVGILIVALFSKRPRDMAKAQAGGALAPLAAPRTAGAAWTWRF